MKRPPNGIYLVAVVFFFSGILCIAGLLSRVFYVVGFDREKRLIGQWEFLVAGLLLFWLLCYGVVALVRLCSGPQWAFFAMTLILMVLLLTEPPEESPFHSTQRIHFNRMLLLLPSLAGCVYLLRSRFRAECREFHATTDHDEE